MKDYESRENPDATYRPHRDHTNVPWASNTDSTRCLIPCGLPMHYYAPVSLKHYETKDVKKMECRENPDTAHWPYQDHTNVPWASDAYRAEPLKPISLPNHHYAANGLKTCVTANRGKTSTSESVGVPT